MNRLIDQIVSLAFSSASVAIFEVGSVMAILMLIFGILDFKKSEQLHKTIQQKKLDQPFLMTLLALIPIDGTLLFQYSCYRRKSIRAGSLLSGIIGIGEEATYLILSFNPLTWLLIALIKILLATGLGSILNYIPGFKELAGRLLNDDLANAEDPDILEADKNFHALPDRFRHKMHHFRYHVLGMAFWILFAAAFVIELTLTLLSRFEVIDPDKLKALGIPLTAWVAMLALFTVLIYALVIRLTTREFGKIYEYEFADTGDAIGDLAENSANIILFIFVFTFIIRLFLLLAKDKSWFIALASHPLLSVLFGALLGLLPGTGASLAFTTLYINLAGTAQAIPFAALVANSIALIGDCQFIGRRHLKQTQRLLHLISFAIAVLTGFVVVYFERYS